MAENTNGVFGFEYLEDAELEQSDVVGCAAVLNIRDLPIICDLRRVPIPTGPLGPIVGGPGGPLGGPIVVGGPGL